jgi:hypothetical protein
MGINGAESGFRRLGGAMDESGDLEDSLAGVEKLIAEGKVAEGD